MISKIDNPIAVISGKGGVGKTTVAVNLAVALADVLKARVGLLDVDITGPNAAQMLGIQHKQMHVDKVLHPVRYDFTGWRSTPRSLGVQSISFLTPSEDTPIVWRGRRKTMAIEQMLERTDWGHLDFLVIDTPPGTSDEVITVYELLRKFDLTCLIVTLPQMISQLDVSKAIQMTKIMGARVIGVLENQSGFWPGDARVVCDKYNLDLLGRIPMESKFASYGDDGMPAYLEDTNMATLYGQLIAGAISKGIFKWKVK